MSYSKINWAYLTPQTADRFNQMEENSVRLAEHKIVGCEVSILGNDTAVVKGGRLEINGNWLYRDGLTTTGMALTASEASAWYSASGGYVATSTAWYIVAYNDSGNSFSCKYRLSAPAYSDTLSGTSTGPLRYDKTGTTWLRYIGEVRNQSGGSFIKYYQNGNELNYCKNQCTATMWTQAATASLTFVNLNSVLTPFNSHAKYAWECAGGLTYYSLPGWTGTGNTGIPVSIPNVNRAQDQGWITVEINTAGNRTIAIHGDGNAVTGWINGVVLNR